MVLPLIVRNTQEALRTVPEGLRSASLGLGATRWDMIRTVLLPWARPGILTGLVLAAGRIVGNPRRCCLPQAAQACCRAGETGC